METQTETKPAENKGNGATTAPETAIAIATPGAAPPAAAPPRTVPTDDPSLTGTLAAFGSSGNFALAQRIATALANSTMVPEAYRGNVPNVLLAIEISNRLNVPVVMVMQNVDIIHGRPGFRAQFLTASVNASGKFTPIRYRWEGKEGDDNWGCRAVAKDRETGEECIGALITMKMVKAEGWYDRKGSKWPTMPEQMFMYRAAGFWSRVYAPELTMGMRTSEENEDMAPMEVLPVPGGLAEVPHADAANTGRRMSLRREPFPASDFVKPQVHDAQVVTTPASEASASAAAPATSGPPPVTPPADLKAEKKKSVSVEVDGKPLTLPLE